MTHCSVESWYGSQGTNGLQEKYMQLKTESVRLLNEVINIDVTV